MTSLLSLNLPSVLVSHHHIATTSPQAIEESLLGSSAFQLESSSKGTAVPTEFFLAIIVQPLLLLCIMTFISLRTARTFVSDQQSLAHRGDLLSNLDSDDPVARTLFKMVDLTDKVLQ